MRRARLTSAGKRERRKLDRLSDELATSMLEPLDTTQRERLQAAMAEVERLLRASLIEIESPTRPRGRALVLEQYFAELAERFEGGFDRRRRIADPAGRADAARRPRARRPAARRPGRLRLAALRTAASRRT